ncbi:MAG: Carbohydrate binding domain protein [Candidatus Izimaplasma bacterium HR2]|nr:MAG: Carbohydrate binding domain protein [Candidatus Izimaplasma bacterium HR2]
MNIKKIFLSISLATFMVFSLSFTTDESFAYWTAGFLGDSETTAPTVATGTWTQAFPWDANATYVIGNLVTNNGTTYQAKKDNPTKEPGVDKGWASQWTAL